MSAGWNHTILDFHGFRQAQAAITTDALLHGGNWLAYSTPVMGAPWSIPFEFPLYQWCVAALVLLFHTPLDQTGRFVNAAFFYATAIPLFGLLRGLDIPMRYRWIVLTAYVVNPFYLYWARTFMIESTALFFAVAYLDSFLHYIRSGSRRRRNLALVFGSLAALVKITTFVGFVIAAILIVYARRRKREATALRESVPTFVLRTGTLIVIPMIYGLLWTRFADWERSLNPIASALSSSAVALWGSGSLAEKFSPTVWNDMLSRAGHDYWGAAAPVVAMVLGLLAVAGRRRNLCIVLLVLFVADMAVFTQLFALHDYYMYANGVFLVAAAGLAIVGAIENGGYWRPVGYTVFALTCAVQIQTTASHWIPVALSAPEHGAFGPNDSFSPLYEAIQLYTKPDDVLVIYGSDWSPIIPYYAHRRALMDAAWVDPRDPRMDTAIGNLDGYSIGAMIFCDKVRRDAALVRSITERYRFQAGPAFEDQSCALHVRRR